MSKRKCPSCGQFTSPIVPGDMVVFSAKAVLVATQRQAPKRYAGLLLKVIKCTRNYEAWSGWVCHLQTPDGNTLRDHCAGWFVLAGKKKSRKK